MSTLFLINTVGTDEDVLNLVESNDHYKNLFHRIVHLEDLDSLVSRLYEDRLLSLPNKWNYETSMSLVIYNPDKITSMIPIRTMNSIFKKFFPTLNISSLDSNDLESIESTLDLIYNDSNIYHDRLQLVDHWMCHSSTSCDTNMYSMLNQLTEAINENNTSTSYQIPRVIRNISFETIINDSKNEDFYFNLLNTWNFSALSLSTSELVQCGYHLMSHLSENAGSSIPANKLYLFLLTVELSYHQTNKFHNFRHAIDVMQATWQICLKLIPDDSKTILLLCLAAIGHDIGHPGTNNSLLQNNSQLKDLFNGQSILENFHFNIFNSILDSQWPQIFKLKNNTNNKLIHDAIIATDMGLHETYVKSLDNIESDLDLVQLISLIIKAADISNVTRPLNISAKWAYLISLEFNDCASLQEHYKDSNGSTCSTHENKNSKNTIKLSEQALKLESERENILDNGFHIDKLLELYPMIPNGQIFFINTFASEFFTKLSIKFPALKFLIDNINSNKEFWISKRDELKDRSS
ncbi:hypothetical protein KAFR_0C05020 [Kazachstania africana CBS 2517]|uniref:Phosphodiesterase n=1 Tax=Kazachstania africana (strain ATCC 22294 / BCRC 22015 / CBS 2517 / CECT 1963 / NBRC 1671 / NRRL Y-8276) TaxID=1071382 RepID=H2ASZ3_KAZAF|nr:hypothetical protein KAFR_0C05020 [Kazachstania africana CBS 2517]CCF57493.1 hypothetical protein KAFR_0C05020 [Kazachstania africana CBS 2517]